jgi:hypothetical protein
VFQLFIANAILWNVRVFRGINKALKQQPRPI